MAEKAVVALVSHKYFQTFDVPILRGRGFTEIEQSSAHRTVIINEELARRTWGEASPIGQQLWSLGGSAEVVGVAGNVRQRAFFDRSTQHEPMMFLSLEQSRNVRGAMTVVIRTEGDPNLLAEEAQAAVWSLAPTLPIHAGPLSMEEVLNRLVRFERAYSDALLFFGTVASLLAALGIYGMIRLLITRRRREFGVRVALGASPRDVVWLASRDGLLLSLIGLGAAGFIAYGATPIIQSVSAERLPMDASFAIFAFPAMFLVAAVASLLPAARFARRSDTINALRAE